MEARPALKRLRLDQEWLPVILSGLIVVLVLLGVRLSLPSYRWLSGAEFAAAAARTQPGLQVLLAEAQARGEQELEAASGRLAEAMAQGDRPAIVTAAAALASAARKARDAELGRTAEGLAKSIGEAADARMARVFSAGNLLRSLYIGLGYLVLSALGVALVGGKVSSFLAGFPIVYAVSWLAQLVAGDATASYLGLEYVIFALLFGLAISNLIGVPPRLKEAVRAENYIKSGLVILGAGILFPEILQAGALGIIQALLVVSLVWYVCFWMARRLKVDDEFAAILSSAVSICGVSAAIATCGAIQGDKKKLSYVISLTLIVAVPMMVLMPWIVRLLGITDAVAGAWIGGTLDTTGSVVAAGALISDKAMRIGTIVKFSQNVLIGVAAFVLSIWWALGKKGPNAERPTAKVIWERFPKFVLGFMAVSLVFSFLLSPALVKETKELLTGLRTVWFAMAFVSIGLETRFTKLVGLGKGRPALAFIGAQLFNVLWTLLLAYLLFGGKIFPLPVLKP